jgi:hypothetical protein
MTTISVIVVVYLVVGALILWWLKPKKFPHPVLLGLVTALYWPYFLYWFLRGQWVERRIEEGSE